MAAKSRAAQRLEHLARQIRVCTKCPLHASRTIAVPGEGNLSAKVMIIGEAPGREEDACGRPFVGAAGRFLNQLLEGAGITRNDCFITNMVKCRPAANRTPTKGEVDTCVENYLLEQIELVNPKLIILLGTVAAKKLLGVTKIGQSRGRLFQRNQRKYLVGYHPASRPVFGKKIEEDFALLGRELRKSSAAT